MQDELPLVYRASLPSIHPWSLACFLPASRTCAGATPFWISGGGCSVPASPYIPQVQACRALLPESSRYSHQSVSFDACRFRADVAVLLVLAQSSRLLPVRGVVLLLRFVNLSSLSLSLPVHLSSFFFLVACGSAWIPCKDALWTLECR